MAMTKDKFADAIIGSIDDDLKSLASMSAAAWHNDTLLLRVTPQDPEEFTDAVEEFMEKLRLAVEEVPFKARYQFIKINDVPGVVFEIKPTTQLVADQDASSEVKQK